MLVQVKISNIHIDCLRTIIYFSNYLLCLDNAALQTRLVSFSRLAYSQRL